MPQETTSRTVLLNVIEARPQVNAGYHKKGIKTLSFVGLHVMIPLSHMSRGDSSYFGLWYTTYSTLSDIFRSIYHV